MNRIYLFVLLATILSACSVLRRDRSQTDVFVYEIYESEYGINFDKMFEIISDEEEKMLDSITSCIDVITVQIDSGKIRTDEKPIIDIENISELSLVYMKERGMGVSDDSAQIQSGYLMTLFQKYLDECGCGGEKYLHSKRYKKL